MRRYDHIGILLLVALLALTGCAGTVPGLDGGSGLGKFARGDVERAKEIAVAAKDVAGAECADAILAKLPAEGVAAQTPLGAFSAFMLAREARRGFNAGVDEQVHNKCAVLVNDAAVTLGKLGLMAVPGGGALGGLLR